MKRLDTDTGKTGPHIEHNENSHESVSPFTPLSPARLLADPGWKALFITDAGRNQILVADLETGTLLLRIGSGEKGSNDGTFETASFDTPMGLVVMENTLVLADSGNDAVRLIDLVHRTVTTLFSARTARIPGFWIPTDIIEVHGILYITATGSGLLWEIDPYYSLLHPMELPGMAGLHPVGLARLNDRIYTTDAEYGNMYSIPIPEGTGTRHCLRAIRRNDFNPPETFGKPTGISPFRESLLVCGRNSVLRINAATGTMENEYFHTENRESSQRTGENDIFSLCSGGSFFYLAGINGNRILRGDPENSSFLSFPLSLQGA